MHKLQKLDVVQQQQFVAESVTFHGRDIFAPAAIKIASGDYSILSPIDIDELVRLHNLGDQINNGLVTYIDSFGNIKTNITIHDNVIDQQVTLLMNQKSYNVKFTRTFLDAQLGELLCYRGSNGTLEIAVNLGSAQKDLNVHIGDTVCLR